MEIYEKLVEKNPEKFLSNVKNVCGDLGFVQIWLKKYEKASKYLDKVLEIDPNNGNAWYNKACVESLRKNADQAIKFLKKAIELDIKYKNLAKKDSDFDHFRESREFKELIG